MKDLRLYFPGAAQWGACFSCSFWPYPRLLWLSRRTLHPPVVLDRVVAVVNKHAILAGDLEDEIRLLFSIPTEWARVSSRRSGRWSS